MSIETKLSLLMKSTNGIDLVEKNEKRFKVTAEEVIQKTSYLSLNQAKDQGV